MKPFRSLLVLLAVAVIGVLGAQWLAQQDAEALGRVIVRSGGFDYSTSLPKAVFLLILGWLVLTLLVYLLRLPFRTWGRYRRRRGRAQLIEGLNALEGGHWQRADRLLGAAADDPETGAVALTAAVRSADARGDSAGADVRMLALAERDPALHAVLAAERLLARGLPVDAINALDVAAAQPLPPRGLVLRAQALVAIGHADEAYGLLGALRQQNALTEPALAALEADLAMRTLQEAADANVLAARWETLPKPLRTDSAVVAAYATRAAALRWNDAALHSIEHALDNQWDERLAGLYGRLPIDHVDSRRASAQRWLQTHPASPGLLLALGRLAAQQGQWQQSRDFLHRAIAEGAGADAWEALGDGLVETGETAAAQQAYANALRAQRGEDVVPLRHPELPAPLEAPAATRIGTLDADGLPPVER